MPIELHVLEAHLPSRQPICAGVVLVDKISGEARLVMRKSWNLASPEDAEVLRGYEYMFRAQLADQGPEAFLQQLRETLSHTLRISEPVQLSAAELENATDLEVATLTQAAARGLL